MVTSPDAVRTRRSDDLLAIEHELLARHHRLRVLDRTMTTSSVWITAPIVGCVLLYVGRSANPIWTVLAFLALGLIFWLAWAVGKADRARTRSEIVREMDAYASYHADLQRRYDG